MNGIHVYLKTFRSASTIYNTENIIEMNLRGHLSENGQNCQISVFCSKSVFRHGGITSQIFRGLAALEPPQNGGQMGEKGRRFIIFFSFSIENEKENEKIFCTFCRKSIKDSKAVFFSF